jgi:hypothetical protein
MVEKQPGDGETIIRRSTGRSAGGVRAAGVAVPLPPVLVQF